jgi:hypothetical protein
MRPKKTFLIYITDISEPLIHSDVTQFLHHFHNTKMGTQERPGMLTGWMGKLKPQIIQIPSKFINTQDVGECVSERTPKIFVCSIQNEFNAY